MSFDKLARAASFFYSLANGEELPKNSKDVDVILDNLTKLETYVARKEYAEKNLERLSSGSARLVYLTSEHTVIKLASNDKGIAQNKVEANPKMVSPFLNKIIKHAPNYVWLETHYLEKITAKEFEKMTGISFEDFDEAISYGLKKISDSDAEKPDNFDKVQKTLIYKEIERVGKRFKLLPGDIGRASSWGSKDGKPVLIDSGLSSDVFDEYYDSKSS